ncbi:unnamed protein product [Prorocentrum cordatum]|nr:unnamed protein product [Polarella glacialis]
MAAPAATGTPAASEGFHFAGSLTDWEILREPMRRRRGRGRLLRQRIRVRGEAQAGPEVGASGAVFGGAAAEAPRTEEFQIVVGADWKSRVLPEGLDGTLRPGGSPRRASGEGGQGHGRNWAVQGAPGQALDIVLDPEMLTVACEEAFSGDESADEPDEAAVQLAPRGCAPAEGPWRGVNLGGWLLLERWMAPGLFEELAPSAEDELSLMSLLVAQGGSEARAPVARFRDAFITREDFRWLRREGGVNAVRLPVGYWCLEEHAAGTPFLPTERYVDKAFDWAEEFGLKVLLELHGASGAQNCEHHSGQRTDSPMWLQGKHRLENLEVLEAWSRRWGSREGFLGLGLGNEVSSTFGTSCPLPPGLSGPLAGLRQMCRCCCCCCWMLGQDCWVSVGRFYAEAAQRCRPHLREGAPFVIDTCWDVGRFDGANLRELMELGPVWLANYHHYQCHGSSHEAPGAVGMHCEAGALYEALRARPPLPGLPLVLGEFSLALKTSVKDYDGRHWQRRYFRQQTRLAQRHGLGWFFWSYKLSREDFHHWSYRECVRLGWISPAAWAGASGRAAAEAGPPSAGLAPPPDLPAQPAPPPHGRAEAGDEPLLPGAAGPPPRPHGGGARPDAPPVAAGGGLCAGAPAGRPQVLSV